MKIFYIYLIALFLLFIGQQLLGQSLTSPKLVTDGPITKMEYSPNLGLIMAGNFKYVGYPAKNIAIVDTSAGDPSGRFPFLSVTK